MQKDIIRQLMIKEQNAIRTGPAGYEFSNKKRNPQIQNEDDIEFVNDANSGFLRQKKCLLSASWWREWCDFTNFENDSDDFSVNASLRAVTEENSPRH